MAIVAFVFWLMSAPAGWLVGEVFAETQKHKDPDLKSYVPIACALLPPLAAIMALVTLVITHLKEPSV